MTLRVLLLSWLLATPVLASLSRIDQSPTLQLGSIGYAGTGCPQGSIDVNFNNGGLDMIFEPSVIRAEVGNGSAPSAQRRACTAQVDFTHTGGWHFALNTMNVTGHLQLDVDTAAQLVIKSFYSGRPAITSGSWTISGPTQGELGETVDIHSAKLPNPAYRNNATVAPLYTNSTTDHAKNTESSFIIDDPLFGPCGCAGMLNVQISAALQQKAARSTEMIWVESAKAGFIWKECES